MIYICKNCKFLFERVGETELCPDCGKKTVQEANEQEKAEYKERILHPEEWFDK